MTFNPDADLDPSRVRKRSAGKTAGIAGGGLVGILALIFGILGGSGNLDLSALTGGGTGDQSETGTDCHTGQDANTNAECRYVATLESLDAYWGTTLPAQTGVQYTLPQAVSFTDQTSSGCGVASAATGPFYCPPDNTVYLDVGFFDQLVSQFGGSDGPLAQEYVVAHEVGHHVQELTGVLDRSGGQQVGSGEGSVRTELMADCLAGMWAKGATTTKDEDGNTFLEPLTQRDIADALSAASAVGDDRIQKAATGQVDPDSWTHGSSAQRQAAFQLGYTTGQYQQCARILTDKL